MIFGAVVLTTGVAVGIVGLLAILWCHLLNVPLRSPVFDWAELVTGTGLTLAVIGGLILIVSAIGG